MHHLAIYNFNNFRVRSDEPVNQGFHDRNDVNFRAAEISKGFIARSGYEGEEGPASWGPQVFPRFYIENGDGWAPSSLSLWRDLPSLFAFSYSGIHIEAMRNARDWFDRHTWPPYVLWWVSEGHVPDWQEGVDRLEHLHDHGPSSVAFDFNKSFDPFGNSTSVDRAAVQRLKAENASAQAPITVHRR
jgi:hypothetical protein